MWNCLDRVCNTYKIFCVIEIVHNAMTGFCQLGPHKSLSLCSFVLPVVDSDVHLVCLMIPSKSL